MDKRQGGAALLGTGRAAGLCNGHLSGGQALRAGKTGCPGVVPRIHENRMTDAVPVRGRAGTKHRRAVLFSPDDGGKSRTFRQADN